MFLIHRNVCLPSIKTNNSWTAQFNERTLTVSAELTVRWKEVGMQVQAAKWQLVSRSSHSSQTGGLKITVSTTLPCHVDIQNHNSQQLYTETVRRTLKTMFSEDGSSWKG